MDRDEKISEAIREAPVKWIPEEHDAGCGCQLCEERRRPARE